MKTKNQAKEKSCRLTVEQLKTIYDKNDFTSYSPEKIFEDSKYCYESLTSAPFFGEETLGVYLKIYEKLGELGYAPAMYELGLLYYNGEWWLEQNFEKSLRYHKKAAELGSTNAMFELYVLYSTGQGVKQNNKLAVEWCIKAAEKDHYRACYNMGAFYATGNGVPKDAALSLKWYKRASEAGNGKASATLGIMYRLGQDVVQDKERAEKYFSLAEEQLFDVEQFLSAFGIERHEKEIEAEKAPKKALKKAKSEREKAEPTLNDYKAFIEKLCKAKKAEELQKIYDAFYENKKNTSAIALIESHEDGTLVENWIALVYNRISDIVGTEAGDLMSEIAEEIFGN